MPNIARALGMAFITLRPLIALRPFLPRTRRPCPVSLKPSARMPAASSSVLDKARFRETWTLFALRVPAKLCNGTRKALKPHVLLMPRVQSVLHPNSGEASAGDPTMIVLLRYLADRRMSSFVDPPKGNTEASFVGADEDAIAERLKSDEVSGKVEEEVRRFIQRVKREDVLRRVVRIGYEHWGLEDVLKNVLPAGVTIPSSFEGVGHIAHLNLREEHEEWKAVIGTVMLEKLGPRIKTVVNKLESTGGPYRTFAMEVLAGENKLVTSVKENGCVFKLDFEKVYWNSRLETEHRRIINSLREDDVLADAFCGVGPFAVPAAKGKCRAVYANDLNPDSVKYLRENAKANRISAERFTASCSCARTFLRRTVRDEKVPVTKVIMNFPSGAPEFLDVFNGLYDGLDDGFPMPQIYCYCFVKGIDDMNSARQRARSALLGKDSRDVTQILPDEAIEVRDIRDVAPRKRQVCVSFRLPKTIATGAGLSGFATAIPPPQKKPRLTA